MSRRHIHLDVVGGIAGDMFVAALIDAVPELRERILSDVAAVLPASAGTPLFTTGTSAGLTVLRFGLKRDPEIGGHHHHHNGSGTYVHMVDLIRGANLSAGTAEHAVAILTILAEAEAAIHDVPLQAVSFHELGDWDSLMDVVASGSIIAALDATWSASDLPLGGGQVRAAHGLLPVPAPATARILEGFEWRDDGVLGERITPTGAAILRHLVSPSRSSGKLTGVGTGAGTRDLAGAPNILRALIFDAAADSIDAQTVAVLCFDIDDMTGEEIGVAAERLRAADGVLDVAVSTLSGKKGRPLFEFRILVRPECLGAAQRLCFDETSTIGLRWRIEQRLALDRSVETSGSAIQVKRVSRPTGSRTGKAESDDLTTIDTLARRRAAKTEAEQ